MQLVSESVCSIDDLAAEVRGNCRSISAFSDDIPNKFDMIAGRTWAININVKLAFHLPICPPVGELINKQNKRHQHSHFTQ